MTHHHSGRGWLGRARLFAFAAGALIAGSLPSLAQTPTPAPVRGGSVTINVHAEAPTLDPLKTTTFGTHYRVGLSYSRLITWKTGADVGYGDFIAKPDLAKSWTVSPDGLTVTLNLRDDVTWHNIPPVNGRAFNSGDVVATLRAIKAEGDQKGLLESVKSIEAPNATTVVLTLSQPNALIITNLAHQNMWILPAEAFNGGYDRAQKVIGTGPFVMTERVPESLTRYARNPKYYGVGATGMQLPYLDEVVVLPLRDLNARILAFRSGQIDVWFGPLNKTQLDGMLATTKNVRVIRTIANVQSELYLSPAVPALADIRVRQAINLAIDRKNLGRVIRGGGKVGGIVAPTLTAFSLPDAEREKLYGTPDIAKAKQLMAAAGFGAGLKIEMTVSNFGEEFVREAEWIKQDLAQIGIDLTLKIVDTPTANTLGKEGRFQALFLLMSPLLEADEYLSTHFTPGAVFNYAGVDDPELLKMVVAQRGENDLAKRIALVQQAQRYAYDKVMNPLPIWTAELLHPVHDRVIGYYPVMSQGFPMFAEMYVTGPK